MASTTADMGHGNYASFGFNKNPNTNPEGNTAFQRQAESLTALAERMLKNNSGPVATNTPNTSGAANNFLGAANNNGQQRATNLLASIDSSNKKQTSTLIDVYRLFQTNNEQIKTSMHEGTAANKALTEQVRKLAAALANLPNSGRNLGSGLLDIMGGGTGRAGANAAGKGGFFARAGRALGGAARMGGRLLGAAALPFAGYEAYSSLNNIAANRNTPLAGNSETGGLMGSRLASYGSLMLNGAAIGGTAGSLFGGVGAIPGAAIGAIGGLGAGLATDFAPDIGNMAHTATTKVQAGSKKVWDAISKNVDSGLDSLSKAIPRWGEMSDAITSAKHKITGLIEDIQHGISDLMNDMYEYVKKQIPSWDDIKRGLGMGSSFGGGGLGQFGAPTMQQRTGVTNTATGAGQLPSGAMRNANTPAVINDPSLSPGERQIARGEQIPVGQDQRKTMGGTVMSRANAGPAINTSNDGLAGNIDSAGIAGVIGKGESRGGQTGIYNAGAGNNYRVGHLDADNTTIAELQRRQNLPSSDPNRVFAAGSYQIIPETMRGAVDALKLDTEKTMFNKDTQNRIFTDYLATQKRPEIARYVTGKSDDLDKAHSGIAHEWASVAYGGRGVYDKDGINHASISDAQIKASLQSARQMYQQKIASGMEPDQARREALLGIKESKSTTALAQNNPAIARAANENTPGTASGDMPGNSAAAPAALPTNRAMAVNNDPLSPSEQMQRANENRNNAQALVGDTTRRDKDDGNTAQALPPPAINTNPNITTATSGDTQREPTIPAPEPVEPAAAPQPVADNSNKTSGKMSMASNDRRSSNSFDDGDFGIDDITMHITSGGLLLVNAGSTS